MKLKIPVRVERIISVLVEHGYEAYAVGGCVRDSILMREPEDWDITTSATPDEVKALFARTVDTGIKHGTVTVMVADTGYEVTTYRVDGAYEDHRHPKDVTFTRSLEEDLKRRDFTMNAMAYNSDTGLVDLFGGMQDIQRKLVRCVGNPDMRFGEDALRVLRALRFCAQLDFSLDNATAQSMMRHAGELEHISAERIQAELVKLVMGDSLKNFFRAVELGITDVILPEFNECVGVSQNNPHHMYTVDEHIIKSMSFVRKDKILRLAMLFHDIGKARTKTTDDAGVDYFFGHVDESVDIARKVLKRLKFDNYTIDRVTRLVKWHDYRPEATQKAMRRALSEVGEDIFPLLFEVQKADFLAQSAYRLEEKIENLNNLRHIHDQIIRERQCFSVKSMDIDGNDLIELGITPGREIGHVLNELLDYVIDNPEMNDKEKLRAFVKKHFVK